MRSATALRRLLVPFFVVLAAACDDAPSPHEPLDPSEEAPLPEAAPSGREPALLDTEHWADGYVWAYSPATSSYAAIGTYSFNRTGNSIQITKPAGTTGRYLVRFGSLSAFLGGKSTLHVTSYGGDDSYCKPVNAYLISSQVEVRCFKAGTGAANNTYFSALVRRKYPDIAFAYAHRPTETNYAPQGQGSWNPKGAIGVFRSGPGSYQVAFEGLGVLASSVGNGGQVQVNAVGTGKNHCKVQGWGGNTTLIIYLQCYTRAGVPGDSKFNVLFHLPSAHLAYAWADQPTASSYSPDAYYRSNPAGGATTITRVGTGRYLVTWSGMDPLIFEGGGVQATAYGSGNAQCQVEGWGGDYAVVRCFAPSGALVDSYFTVLFGS